MDQFHVKEPLETGDLSGPGGVLVNALAISREKRVSRKSTTSSTLTVVSGLLSPQKQQPRHSSTVPHYCRSLPRWCIHSASVDGVSILMGYCPVPRVNDTHYVCRLLFSFFLYFSFLYVCCFDNKDNSANINKNKNKHTNI